MRFSLPLAALSALATFAMPSAANAALLVSMQEVGTSVVATISGSFTFTGLSTVGTYQAVNQSSALRSSTLYYGNAVGTTVRGYYGFTGPASIGTSALFANATSASGLGFFINSGGYFSGGASSPVVGFDTAYTSGSDFAGVTTFANRTLADFGLAAGDSVYRSSNDTITFRVGQAAVASPTPEPATWATMIAGFGLVGGAMRRRRRAAFVAA